MKIGTLNDRYLRIRRERLDFEAELKKLKSKESAAQDALREAMLEENLDRVTGALGTVSIKTISVPKATDWTAFYAWVKRTGNFECLQKRLNAGAIAEVLADKPRTRIGGVVFENVLKVSASEKRS